MTDIPTAESPMTPEEADDALAAEYVLGVLDHAERLQVASRIKTDATFAARVVAWEGRLAGLNDDFAEAPAPNLLPQIEARLFPKPAKPRSNWMRWFAGALVAASLVAGALLLMPGTPQATLVAELGTQSEGLVYLARHDGTRLEVTRAAGTRPAAGQDHELWIIAPGAAPVSLGLLRDAPLSVEYPRPPAGWVLAVSVEPEGGSTTGAPTGPVILTAEVSL